MKLHWKALSAEQREVFRACARPTARWNAYLAGGTALALHLGHRRSEDLDWFTPETLDAGQVLADVGAMGFPLEVFQNDVGTFLAMVGGVKFSVFRYRYAILEPFVVADGVNLASLRDLAAMKLAAVMARATKRDLIKTPAGARSFSRRRSSIGSPVPSFRDRLFLPFSDHGVAAGQMGVHVTVPGIELIG